MAKFKVAAEVPQMADYKALECTNCTNWFLWPKKAYRKSAGNPSFCPHCGVKFEE